MSWRRFLVRSVCLSAFLGLVCSPQASSQDMAKATVVLRINQVEASFAGTVLVFEDLAQKEEAYALPPDRHIQRRAGARRSPRQSRTIEGRPPLLSTSG